MIKYTLKCDQDHKFDSWFQSGKAFDSLLAAGHVSCAICGSTQVSKAIMAPPVRTTRKAAPSHEAPAADAAVDDVIPEPEHYVGLGSPDSQAEAALAEMRRKVEENSDYVGADFTKTARDMHLGETPERSIYGTANLEQAKSLIEDGVPVLPLPFIPKTKVN